MKSFTKRIIWFFGFWTFMLINDYLSFIIDGAQTDTTGYLVLLIIWLLPLAFMKDDKILTG